MGIGNRLWAATLFVSLGCREDERPIPSGPLPPTPPAAWPVWDASPVQTDSLVYVLRRSQFEYRAIVNARYTNRTGAPIYFQRCTSDHTTPMFWMMRVGADSTRRFFVDWSWPCVGGVPAGAVMPGESMTVAVPFGSMDQPTMQPPLQPQDMVGLFRIYLTLCTLAVNSEQCSSVLPLQERLSNAFEIKF
jgi:hypothetical protein